MTVLFCYTNTCCYSKKEPTKNFDLIKHPNFICTPHLGASSREAQNRCGIDVANQIVNYVRNNVLEGGVSVSNDIFQEIKLCFL